MPGTIHVSVLDVDLPSSYSSSFYSSISVKVSLGKREYQTLAKGDFSFPLTSLRDNLVLTLLDAEGNELSRTGVEMMSVVEKGIWDDLFPLEGGGHLHMKLQLILSDEERRRVQEMRESAMKKKCEELRGSHKQLETPDATVGVNVMPPSLFLKHEVADKPAQNRATSNSVSHSNNPLSCPLNKGGTPLDQLEKNRPNGSEVNPSKAPPSKVINVLDPIKAHHMNFDGKFEIVLPASDVPVRPNASLEMIDSQLGCSESSVAKPNSVPVAMRKYQTHTPEGTKFERTPSSVRNLISAFESSLPQEVGAHGSTPTTRSQSRKTGLPDPLEGPFEKETIREKTKSMQQVSAEQSNSLSRGRFWEVRQQSPKHMTKQEEHLGFDAQTAHGTSAKLLSQSPGQLVVLSSRNTPADQMKSSGMIKFSGVGKLEHRHEENESLEDFTGPSTTEIATVSGRMLDGPLATNEPCALCLDQQDFALGFALEDNGWRNCRENSDKLNIFEASNIWNGSVAHESPGIWILPDGSRRMCITTGSKQVMDLMRSWGICRESHQGEMNPFKMEAFDEHDIHDDTDNWVNKDEVTSQCLRKSNLEGSGDVTNSGGLIGQVAKVVIMVAFGTLVLLTRQRKSR